jgi:orotate phosphoribosyltransferase
VKIYLKSFSEAGSNSLIYYSVPEYLKVLGFMQFMSKQLLKELKEMGIIYKEPVELKHGGQSEFYVDIKKAYGDYSVVEAIADEIKSFIPDNTTCIAASGYGGIRLAGRLCDDHYYMLAMVRDKPKEHGKPGFIDGYEPGAGDSVYIVDDVFTTGKSLRAMVRAVVPTGATILGCGVVVKRCSGDLRDLGITLDHLFTEKDFL